MDARPADGIARRKLKRIGSANTAIQKVREAYFSIQIIRPHKLKN